MTVTMTVTTSRELPDFEDKSHMLVIMRNALVINPDGTCTYHSNFTDLKVATLVNPLFKAHHAASIRRSRFGKLTTLTPPALSTPPLSRLDTLEARIIRIIDALSVTTHNPPAFRRRLLDGPSTTAHLDDISD